MADVRSLLRSELASRGSAQTGSTGTRVTKKRKIESNDDAVRKKSRAARPSPTKPSAGAKPSQASTSHLEQDEDREREALNEEELGAGPELPPEDEEEEEDKAEEVTDDAERPVAEDQLLPSSAPAANSSQTIDEDEWAAFEREVVAPTRVPRVPVAAMAPATISAAPVSAAELAAQQRKEKEDLARAREADAEGEKEDAARLLEEEFDEMEQLEERLKRLKEKREQLRKRQMEEDIDAAVPVEQDTNQQAGAGSDESDDEDAGDDWDDWRFR
jgi:hypothetical protein